ncbi:hypothetical protein PIROE2DRAFT_4617 [Piromyces sp. E2]|nr:hypothetical protein PIROE2DRAFT_4617 [Piromyces sp. E2]|eukprot:OUM67808.1 hypothetical protein PIROE2DRAFT_4617 [Piromyces sp. E2]
MKLILEYANKNHILINLNETNDSRSYPLLRICYDNNIDMAKVLIKYANKNNNILELNQKENNGKIMKILINYENKNNIVLRINETDIFSNYPMLVAIMNNSIESVRLLIEYANNHYITLQLNSMNKNEINQKNYYGDYPLLYLCKINDSTKVNLLFEYVNHTQYCINNYRDKDGKFPLLWTTYNNNIDMTQLLIKYSTEKNVELNLNEKDNIGNYLLLYAIDHSINLSMTQMLFEYASASGHNVILNLNGEDIKNIYNI